MKHSTISRRRLLRGMLQGTAVSVGLPMLDLFLNENGTALASGDELPVCFGTWFWGLGLSPGMWEPKTEGRDYELPLQLQVFEPIKDKINIFSDLQVFLDGKPQTVHTSSVHGMTTGSVPGFEGGFGTSGVAQTIDDLIGEQLGVRTRFRSLTMSCDGRASNSFSARGKNAANPAEVSPVELYQRIFGAGFVDPNAAEFVPDPEVMLRKSSLSFVTEDRNALMKEVGSSDRQRLDEFFTSLRDLEQKLALELEKPKPLEACSVPNGPDSEKLSLSLYDILDNHELFGKLVTHALACGQTRIFNMALSVDVVKPGDPTDYHAYTHQENADPELGYQPKCFWFASRYMEAFRDMVQWLDGVKEGDGTLLDRTLMMAFTEHGYAKWHSMEGFPMFTAGGAGGGMKTGYHVAGRAGTAARVGYTCQKALGLPVNSWGTESNRVTEPFADVLA